MRAHESLLCIALILSSIACREPSTANVSTEDVSTEDVSTKDASTKEAPPSAVAVPTTIVDLTHPFDDTTIYWPTEEKGFGFEKVFAGTTDAGFYYTANRFAAAEHGGTHLDAPIHFWEGGASADTIALERLVGPGVVVDVREKAAADRDYLVGVDDFTAWEAANGRLPEGAIVLLRTGFGEERWPDRERYLGTAERGAEAVAKLHFPGLDPAAAAWLAEERKIDAIGIDTASIDRGQSTLFESHVKLFSAGIPAFENVAHLDALPSSGFLVVALPMKIAGGSGGPLRIVAWW